MPLTRAAPVRVAGSTVPDVARRWSWDHRSSMAVSRRPYVGSARLQLADLARSADDRVLAGVCGGAGAGLGLDPMVVRLAVIVLTFANGLGIAVYALAWA